MENQENISSVSNNQNVPVVNNISEQKVVVQKSNYENDQEKGLAAVAYVPFGFLAGLIIPPKRSVSLSFHLNQGVVFTFLVIAVDLLLNYLTFSFLVYLVLLWRVLAVIYFVKGLINVFSGEDKPLPYIGTWFKIIR